MAAAVKELFGAAVKNKSGDDVAVDSFCGEGKYVGLYFSAHWCPPCRGFTPVLVNFYNKMREAGKTNLEIIFVSCDRDDKSFKDYYAEMPWLTMPFDDQEQREKVMKKFGVSGIPAFVILDAATGAVYEQNGRGKVTGDLEGASFPWK